MGDPHRRAQSRGLIRALSRACLRRTGGRFRRGYRERVALASGESISFRLLGRRDSAVLERIFARLSPKARYQRFFAHKSALSGSDLRTLTRCDGKDQIAIVAFDQRTSEPVGVARFVRDRIDPVSAEVAVAVIDAHHRKGIGRLLLQRIMEAARHRGIREVKFLVLADNAAMTALAYQLGGRRQPPSAQGDGFSTLVVPLDS